MAETKVTENEISASLLEILYPVGAIYISGSATMPSVIDDIGTWTRLEGVVIVGASDTDTDFDNGDTGGAKTHTLTESEMPEHTHIQNAHNHGVYYNANSGQAGSTEETIAGSGGSTSTTSTTATNQNAGSDNAHNNLQPYKAKYMWERTA